MPVEKRSNRKNDAKEQRKARRRHDPQVVKKEENEQTPINQEPAVAPKVTAPETPANELPGPEFYKSLKRETDEILKITEEANLKYKKKEIQSNWAKYEMPIDSYNEIEEQENIGADYETRMTWQCFHIASTIHDRLASELSDAQVGLPSVWRLQKILPTWEKPESATLSQAPLSVGGHFQFKHEKSWDINTGPSLYDKYFEIGMNNLAIALSTIPFYERNSIEQSIFNETDILNMNNRATKYKQKYYNDKSYTTPDLEVQDKILNSLSDSDKMNQQENPVILEVKDNRQITTKVDDITKDTESITKEIILENINTVADQSPAKFKDIPSTTENETKIEETRYKKIDLGKPDKLESTLDENTETKLKDFKSKNIDDIDDIIDIIENKVDQINSETKKLNENAVIVLDANKSLKVDSSPVKEKEDLPKDPVIESPEDLEKWLDDFLDG